MLQGTSAYPDNYGNIYTPIDGIVMGSPLGPTLSNFSIVRLEKKLMVYARYNITYDIDELCISLGLF